MVTLYSGTTIYGVTTCDATGFYAFFDINTSLQYYVKADGTRWSLPVKNSSTYAINAGDVLTIDIDLATGVREWWLY